MIFTLCILSSECNFDENIDLVKIWVKYMYDVILHVTLHGKDWFSFDYPFTPY